LASETILSGLRPAGILSHSLAPFTGGRSSSDRVIYNHDEDEHEKQRQRFINAGLIQHKFDLCDEEVDSHFMILPKNIDDPAILKILELKNIIQSSNN